MEKIKKGEDGDIEPSPSVSMPLISPSFVSSPPHIEVLDAQETECQKYYQSNYVNIKFWKRLDWLVFVLLLLLGMLAIGSVISNLSLLIYYDYPRLAEHPRILRHMAVILLAAGVLLLCGVIFGHLFLHFLRNLVFFLITFFFLLCAALLIFYLIVYVANVLSSSTAMLDEIYDSVREQIDNVGYKYTFFALQAEYKCCGVHDFRDWQVFNPLASLDSRSLPRSCLQDELKFKNYTWGALRALEKNPAELYQVIHKNGCSRQLTYYYYRVYLSYQLDLFIILILIILAMVFLTILIWRWYNKAQGNLRTVRGDRRLFEHPEDGVPDSEYSTIAPTPMTTKSVISNYNVGFFAP